MLNVGPGMKDLVGFRAKNVLHRLLGRFVGNLVEPGDLDVGYVARAAGIYPKIKIDCGKIAKE
jgi:hypothetical protein